MLNRHRLALAALLIASVVAAACGPSRSAAPNTAAPASAAATQPAAGLASEGAPAATAANPTSGAPAEGPTAGPFTWQVDIVQGGQTNPAGAGDILLARAPFTIRVTMPAPIAIKLNALDTDQNFQTIQPGMPLTGDCWTALCQGMDVAEEPLNPRQALYVDALSTHYLHYAGPTDHRWSRATVTDSGAVFERDVALLNDLPVEQYSAPALYLLLLANATNPDVIDPGELSKITIVFQ